MNGFVLIILSVISMLLLHMKVQMELPDMRKRYQFMNRLGMNRRERICIEKKEISRFVTIPSVIVVIVTVLYSGSVDASSFISLRSRSTCSEARFDC